MQRNNDLEFPKSVNFSQSLVPSSAAFHTEIALLHNSETYMRIPPLCFLTCSPTLQGLATVKCWYLGMTRSCWSGKWCVFVSAKISTLESNSCKVGEVRSFVHAPPWIFQQQKLTTFWPLPPMWRVSSGDHPRRAHCPSNPAACQPCAPPGTGAAAG